MAQDWNEWLSGLYQACYPRMHRVAYRLTGSIEMAEDLTHEVFLLALFQQDKVASHPKPEAWLMVTLVNLAKNERRRKSSQEISLETLLHLPAPETPGKVEELLPTGLSQEDRQVLIWRFAEGLSHREIGDRLGISENGSQSRVFRALQACRKRLKEQDLRT